MLKRKKTRQQYKKITNATTPESQPTPASIGLIKDNIL